MPSTQRTLQTVRLAVKFRDQACYSVVRKRGASALHIASVFLIARALLLKPLLPSSESPLFTWVVSFFPTSALSYLSTTSLCSIIPPLFAHSFFASNFAITSGLISGFALFHCFFRVFPRLHARRPNSSLSTSLLPFVFQYLLLISSR